MQAPRAPCGVREEQARPVLQQRGVRVLAGVRHGPAAQRVRKGLRSAKQLDISGATPMAKSSLTSAALPVWQETSSTSAVLLIRQKGR
jgi:hypothetical protein